MERLMKKSCLNDEMLASFIEGNLSDKDCEKVTRHLSECDHCVESLMITRGLVDDKTRIELDQVPETMTDSAVRLVHRQMSASGNTVVDQLKHTLEQLEAWTSRQVRYLFQGEWRYAPIRGSKRFVSNDLIHVKKIFKQIHAEVEIERIGNSRSHIRVKIIKNNGRRRGIRVTLVNGDREVSSLIFENQGYLLFDDIPYGHYRLEFVRDGERLGTYRFEVKESLNG
jgi:Putative zinc-finger